MSGALQSIHSIKPATTDLTVQLAFVLFSRVPLCTHAGALEALWGRLQEGLFGTRFAFFRKADQRSWRRLPEPGPQTGFSELFGISNPLLGQWGLELAEQLDEEGNCAGTWLQLTDRAPVRTMERASHLRLRFPAQTPSATIAAVGEWAINQLPLWWGAGGLVFHHTRGSLQTAHRRMAALAKRYWGVQIQDMTALQWDALRGMPGVNWLTLIGSEFAQFKGIGIERMVAGATDLADQGVFHRRGPKGIALAAGPKPIRGDINSAEDIGAYRSVARLIQPFLLTAHSPLAGPFASAEVLHAWLGRFINPQAWLECDLDTE